MTKYWLAGAAAFAMMTGVAFAEGMPSESTTTRSTTTVPAVGSHKSSESHRAIDRDGYATKMKRIYHSDRDGMRRVYHSDGDGMRRVYHGGADGWKATSRTLTMSHDGSARTTYRVKQTGSPYSGSSTEKTTTTTIDR
jgi:hypothetical protein